MDYGFVPVTDRVTRLLNELIARRVPRTTMRTASAVKGFVEDLNNDLSLHPADDLVIGAHANSEGQWFILLYPNQIDLRGEPTSRTEYENLEQTLEASAAGITRRIRIDDQLIGWTGPPPTHNVHIKGYNLGKAKPFLTKLKQALGDHVNVTAAKHFQAVVRWRKKNNDGSFEYMCYEFQVQTPAVPKPTGGFRGFATRADLLTALGAAGHEYLGGFSVPAADWKKWVPKDIEKTQSFFMSLPLGRTVAGLKEIMLRPNKKDRTARGKGVPGPGDQGAVEVRPAHERDDAGRSGGCAQGGHRAGPAVQVKPSLALLRAGRRLDTRCVHGGAPLVVRSGGRRADDHRTPHRVHGAATDHRQQRAEAEADLQLLPGHRHRPSGSICDSLAVNGGGKYPPTYVRRVLAVS